MINRFVRSLKCEWEHNIIDTLLNHNHMNKDMVNRSRIVILFAIMVTVD